MLTGILLLGCEKKEVILEDGYEYVIGVSLSNVMEPWLNRMVDGISAKLADDSRVNVILKDAASNSHKQIKDIQQLMECGIDLLVVAPSDVKELSGLMEECYVSIPVIVVGIEPKTTSYTTFISFDDYSIGKMGGEYVIKQYTTGDEVVVLEGLSESPISKNRLRGFRDTVEGEIAEGAIHYMNGEWLRDKAENRMKDYVVTNQEAQMVFAFNDEMAYGAYLAMDQYRITNACILGVDGFSGNMGGADLVERGILDATIQCSEMGELVSETAIRILDGKEVEKDIVIQPRMIENQNYGE